MSKSHTRTSIINKHHLIIREKSRREHAFCLSSVKPRAPNPHRVHIVCFWRVQSGPPRYHKVIQSMLIKKVAMPRHFSYPSIGLFRIAVKTVNERCERVGVSPKPKLCFKGTVKLHGVNTAVVLSGNEIYAQSREIVLSPDADLNGFAAWVKKNEVEFRTLLAPQLLSAQQSAPPGEAPHTVALYGEWCGKGVLSGVAISKLDRMFMAFGLSHIRQGVVRVNSEMVQGEISTWTKPGALSSVVGIMVKSDTILCIEDFPSWEIEIDFEHPERAQLSLVQITQEVEKQCPVAMRLGVDGMGEGVVWTCTTPSLDAGILTDDLRFKVKGEKHSDNASRELAPVEIEHLKSVQACADMVGTEHRFEKGIDHLQAQHPGVEVGTTSFIRPFLKWVEQDVNKEEADTIEANGLDPKEVGKVVGHKARAWFLGRQARGQAQAQMGG